jgi:hypothetical protein
VSARGYFGALATARRFWAAENARHRAASAQSPVSIPNADEIEAALRLKALLDGIDAAGGTITVEFPEGDPQ